MQKIHKQNSTALKSYCKYFKIKLNVKIKSFQGTINRFLIWLCLLSVLVDDNFEF